MLPIRSTHNLELTVESSNEASLVPAQELIEGINFKKLNSDRLERLQSVMRQEGVPACLFFHPANIRYATGAAVMDVHTAGASERYCLVPSSGEPILFEWGRWWARRESAGGGYAESPVPPPPAKAATVSFLAVITGILVCVC